MPPLFLCPIYTRFPKCVLASLDPAKKQWSILAQTCPQEFSLAPQFKNINSSALSLLYGPTLNIHTKLYSKFYISKSVFGQYQ